MYNKNFINQCFRNLDQKKIFYKYFNEEKNYSDLKNFFFKFKDKVDNERLKIVTFSDKSFEMYATIASIFLSNNVWIPLSTTLPINRLIDILKMSGAQLIILENNSQILKNKTLKKFIKKNKIDILFYNQIKNSKKKLSTRNIIPRFNYDEVSMIYFTSGSTGNPKGVPLTYNNFINCFKSKEKILYKKCKNLIFGDYHDPSFVISLVIFFPCFFLGSTISPSRNIFETLNPSNHIEKNKVNILITVPSTISRIKESKESTKKLKKLSKIIMCGEPFRLSIAKFIIEKIKPKELYNFYGSTEVAPWIFFHKLKKKDLKNYEKFDLVPVGRPLTNVKVKIENNELIVSGPVVSNGYLDPKQNKDIFIKSQNTIWYKTKDQVMIYKNKYFVKGRIDKVVKLHGFRVDLGDIEINIRKLKDIEEAIVYLKNRKDKKILSCALKTQANINQIYFINCLSKKLPNYMIPQNIRFYKKFPLNRSGKIDRKKIMI